ncbi:hypothetical protein, partial [Streptomyces californicus]|uniref:hypothetical protein n=1 Tax=Streptomyces californicus TaxID=67351 RepID=UPI00380CA79D
PETIARTINDYVQADASDGFILVPHITPTGTPPGGGAAVLSNHHRRPTRRRDDVGSTGLP